MSKIHEPCQTKENLTSPSYDRWVRGCQQGDPKIQQEVYDHFAPGMLVVALRYSKSQQEAEDVLQESFVKVFRSIGKLNDSHRIAAWIKRIVINTALNSSRSKLYMLPMYDVPESHTHVEVHGLANLQLQDLIDLIQQLPTGCQVVFNMYVIEGYSHREIAEQLNVSEGTSKSQLARARMLLKEQLEEREEVRYGTN